MRPNQPKWTVGFNWMPFNADRIVYPGDSDDDSWVGTGMCFFDTEKAADEFYRGILPLVTQGGAGSFKRPFCESDWDRVGAAHERPDLTQPAK